MKNGKIIILLFLIMPGWLANFVSAKEINVSASKISASPIVPSWTWQSKIQEGIALLKQSPALVYEYKTIKNKRGKIVKSNEILRKQISLAILNTNNGAVFEKRVWVTEEAIKNYRKLPVVLMPVAVNELLDIQPQYWNSFNTPYVVNGHPEMVVIANRYLIESKSIGNLPEKSKDKYTAIYYIPYSPSLHQTELIDAGKKYIEQTVNRAFSDLASRSLVQDHVSKEFLETLIMVEHVDPDSFSIAADGGKMLAERVLVVIGTNQQTAYRYTGSPAGANGLAQFIRPTYNTIVKTYPSADLIPDYLQGMADHTNAVKAMVLFFDAYKKEIIAKIINKDLLTQLGINEEMLAATYNGGVNRVTKSLNKFGSNWLTAQIDLPKNQRSLAGETLTYLKKFLAIRDLGILRQ